MVTLGRVVFTSREHVIALEPRGKGLLGITLRYPYEVRKENEYFAENSKRHAGAGRTHRRNQQGAVEEEAGWGADRNTQKVINLMDALRRSVEAERGGSARRQAPAAERPKKKKSR
jgi:DNA end-binding protein Ku